MNGAVERLDDGAHRRVATFGRTVVRRDDLVRHPVYTRLLHWAVAIFFLLALVSGFAIYSPWLYRALTPLFGGGPMTRLLHPWFSIAFVLLFAFQFVNWLRPMTWNQDDRRWMKRMRSYVTNAEEVEPEYVDFFNAGQKLYFWAIAGTALIFLLSGIPMWFPEIFGRVAVAISSVFHGLAALVMLGSFIVHLYEGTAAQPGTFSSMTRGTVTRPWAWTHHPAWYRRVTGRDPRADHEQARATRAPDSGAR